MRAIGITRAAMVLLLCGIAAPSYADRGQQGESRDHSSQQQNNRERNYRKHRQSQRVQEQQRVRHGVWQEHRARSWESDHRTWEQRGGYEGYRVPDTRFRRYFGPQHSFRVNSLPFRVMGGHPNFQYRGYWLSLVDPWPEYWSDDWYDTDDVYVGNVDNGYYLFNRRHPEVRISLRISR